MCEKIVKYAVSLGASRKFCLITYSEQSGETIIKSWEQFSQCANNTVDLGLKTTN